MNQIYKIGRDGLVSSWAWDFKENNNSEKDIKRLTSEIEYKSGDNHNSVMTDYIGEGKPLRQFIYTSCESNRFKIALMEHDNNFLHVFHDKSNKMNRVFTKTKENTIFHTCTYSDNTFIYFDQPFVKGWRDLTCITKEVLGEKYNLYKNIIDDYDSNPVVILFHLKK